MFLIIIHCYAIITTGVVRSSTRIIILILSMHFAVYVMSVSSGLGFLLLCLILLLYLKPIKTVSDKKKVALISQTADGF